MVTTPNSTKTTKIAGMAEALKTFGFTGEDADGIATALHDIEISKAFTSQSLTRGEQVEDRWNEGQMHRTPSREEIRTGPVEYASGGGAEKMVRDYANPAPQTRLTEQSERLAEHLGSMRAYAKANDEMVGRLLKGQEMLGKVLTTILEAQAAKAAPPTVGVGDEAVQFARWNLAKAEEAFGAAKLVLSKAASSAETLDELEGEARRAMKTKVKGFRKIASRMLLDGLMASYAAAAGEDTDPGADLRKAITALLDSDPALKADVAAMHDKKRNKGKDDKACARKAMRKFVKALSKKAAKKAAKLAKKAAAVEAAKSDEKGQQADKQDADTKNQDDSAKKALETAAAAAVQSLEAATKAATDTVTATVQEFMEAVAGRPLTNHAKEPLVTIKGGGATPDSMVYLEEKIENMADNGELSDSDALSARSMLGKLTAVHAGAMTKSVWEAELNSRPPAVQAIFKAAA